jgi:uncharacterized protein
MFGLSFTKLMLLAILILIVWYGFKYASRVEAVRQALLSEALRHRQAGGTKRPAARPVEDLVKCARCGSFVSAQGAANCGKPQCPWGA